MEDKNIIAINAFGRTFNDLKIHFLFKYFKIKQVQISNIGNLQTQITPIKNNKDDIKINIENIIIIGVEINNKIKEKNLSIKFFIKKLIP